MHTGQNRMNTGKIRYAQLLPLLTHVEQEEAALHSIRNLLQNIPLSIMSPESERALRHSIDQVMQQAEHLTQRRAAVLVHTGRLAGLRPAEVTFSALMRTADAEALTALSRVRCRLDRVVTQVQLLSASVAWVAAESRSISSIVLQEVLGEVSSDRYNANGHRALDPGGIRFEARS